MPAELPEWLIGVAERVNEFALDPIGRILLISDVRTYAEDVERWSKWGTRFEAERTEYAARIAKRTKIGPLTNKTRKQPRPGWRFDYLSWREDDGLHHVEAWVPPRLCRIPPEYEPPLPLVEGRVLTRIERSAVLAVIRDVVYKGIQPIDPAFDAKLPRDGSLTWSTDIRRLLDHYAFRALKKKVPALTAVDRASIKEMLRLLWTELDEKEVLAVSVLFNHLKDFAAREAWETKNLPAELTLQVLQAFDNRGWLEVEVRTLAMWVSPQRFPGAAGSLETMFRNGYRIRASAAARGALAEWEIESAAGTRSWQIPSAELGSVSPLDVVAGNIVLKPKQVEALNLIGSRQSHEIGEILRVVDGGILRTLDNFELIQIGAQQDGRVHWFSPQRSNGVIFVGVGGDDWVFILDMKSHEPDSPPLIRVSAKGKAVLADLLLPVQEGRANKEASQSPEIHPATLAKAILFEEPGISSTELARRIKVSPGTLYSTRGKWKDVRALLKGRPKPDKRGAKSQDGQLEAWGDDEDANRVE